MPAAVQPPFLLLLVGPVAGILTLTGWQVGPFWLFWTGSTLLLLDLAVGVATGAKSRIPAVQMIAAGLAIITINGPWFVAVLVGVAIGSLLEGLGHIVQRLVFRGRVPQAPDDSGEG
ncbi:hypothetical protein [Roseospira goensis]|uniref:Uncharacterized protein n=1 Tax=Roseospira goensis TaxID=391922 RepID=A0A7W6RZ58_9PROT|nr:hypothetical protein [Roseospira goensis]MBB4285934.1 hypothetical protein [Roseospira goensis]